MKNYFIISDFEVNIKSLKDIISRLVIELSTQFDNYSLDFPFNPLLVKLSLDNMYNNWGKEGLA